MHKNGTQLLSQKSTVGLIDRSTNRPTIRIEDTDRARLPIDTPNPMSSTFEHEKSDHLDVCPPNDRQLRILLHELTARELINLDDVDGIEGVMTVPAPHRLHLRNGSTYTRNDNPVYTGRDCAVWLYSDGDRRLALKTVVERFEKQDAELVKSRLERQVDRVVDHPQAACVVPHAPLCVVSTKTESNSSKLVMWAAQVMAVVQCDIEWLVTRPKNTGRILTYSVARSAIGALRRLANHGLTQHDFKWKNCALIRTNSSLAFCFLDTAGVCDIHTKTKPAITYTRPTSLMDTTESAVQFHTRNLMWHVGIALLQLCNPSKYRGVHSAFSRRQTKDGKKWSPRRLDTRRLAIEVVGKEKRNCRLLEIAVDCLSSNDRLYSCANASSIVDALESLQAALPFVPKLRKVDHLPPSPKSTCIEVT